MIENGYVLLDNKIVVYVGISSQCKTNNESCPWKNDIAIILGCFDIITEYTQYCNAIELE